MEMFYWIIIYLFFLIGVLGTFIPIIPDMIPIWIGVIIFKVSPLQVELGIVFWITLTLITIINIMADFISNAYFVKKRGGAKFSGVAAIVGLIFGIVIMPPLGLLIGPFLAVLAIELYMGKGFKSATKVALSTLLAYFSSGLVKIILQILIVTYFMVETSII
jgi:uncharacterized protein YqgC (DUF456 family)